MNETFWTLLHNGAHWEFELFLMFIFDGIIGVLIWPRMKKWIRHHKSDDEKAIELERRIQRLEDRLDINGLRADYLARLDVGMEKLKR